MLAFDIETGALPEDQLRELLPPFDESKVDGVVTGDFDSSSVKTGNLKDQAKIAEKIEAARAAHESAKANTANIIAAAREKHWQDFVRDAALSAITGRILVISYHATEKSITLVDEGEEPRLISSFWRKYEECHAAGRKMVGSNIGGFDIPFIVRRSWLLDIKVPPTVFDKGKWLDFTTLVDLMSLWSCGNRDYVKLNDLAKAFGVGEKTNGITGADFARLYLGTADERALALRYAANDVEITAKVGVRMGIV